MLRLGSIVRSKVAAPPRPLIVPHPASHHAGRSPEGLGHKDAGLGQGHGC